ncbi:MAG: prolipoprotein diacylglyceryl transferase [Armatimonadota bacterium]
MRPILFTFPGPSLQICMAIFIAALLIVGAWMLVLHYKKVLTRDHLYTGSALLVVIAILLAVVSFIPEIRINAYGTMLMFGFVAGTLAAIHLGRRRDVPAERIIDLGVVILVGAIIGARGLYVLMTPGAGPFIDMPRVLREGLGGLSFHGGLLGGLLAGGAYIAYFKMRFWRVADCIAPGIALGYAITRIGCFLNGCCYGKPAPEWLPWPLKMEFPHWPGHDIPAGFLYADQLYASAMGIIMFVVLLLLARAKSLYRAGRLFMIFLMMEGVERFVMEIYRAPDSGFHGGLTAAQIASVFLVIAGIIGWFKLPKYPAVVEQPVANVEKPKTKVQS